MGKSSRVGTAEEDSRWPRIGHIDQEKAGGTSPAGAREQLGPTKEEARSILDAYQGIQAILSRRYTLKGELRKKLHAVNLRYALEVHDGTGNWRTDKYVDGEGERLEGEIKGVWLRVQEEVKALDGEDIRHTIKKYGLGVPYQSYRDYMEGISDKIHELLRKASRIREDLAEQALVTTDSYLMCRCGGRIEVLSSVQWVEEVDSKVDEHIVEILQFAEENIYGLMQTYGAYADTPDTEDYANSRYSTLIALNGIHVLLRSMGKEGKYDAIKDMEEVRKKYPLPNISIDLVPQNEVEAMEARQAIAREAVSNLPFGLNWIFKVLFFMMDRSNRFENEGDSVRKVAEGQIEGTLCDKMEKGAGIVAEAGGAVGDIADVVQEVLKNNDGLLKKDSRLRKGLEVVEGVKDSDLVNAASSAVSAVTWCQLLQDFMTRSYALFIGKITIEINTGWDRYTYEADYDGNGERIDTILYRRSYLGRDMFTNLGTAHFYNDGDPYMYNIYEGDGAK